MSAIMRLAGLMESAKGSKWGVRRLNFILPRVIPFNKPHGFRIRTLDENECSVEIPYKRRNLNHLKGIHACAIATASEYCSGIYLLSRLSPATYRIIMKSIHVEYHYQARMPCKARFHIDEEKLQKEVVQVIEEQGDIMSHFVAEVHDTEGAHIATATMEWQLKKWTKVKSK